MPGYEAPTQIHAERSVFDRFAERSSEVVGRALFFTLATLVVVVWMPTVVLFESVDTWQLVLNTATSVVAFLLIALLQNSERRNDRALHRKLDALAAGQALQLRQMVHRDDDELRDGIAELEAAIGLESEI